MPVASASAEDTSEATRPKAGSDKPLEASDLTLANMMEACLASIDNTQMRLTKQEVLKAATLDKATSSQHTMPLKAVRAHKAALANTTTTLESLLRPRTPTLLTLKAARLLASRDQPENSQLEHHTAPKVHSITTMAQCHMATKALLAHTAMMLTAPNTDLPSATSELLTMAHSVELTGITEDMLSTLAVTTAVSILAAILAVILVVTVTMAVILAVASTLADTLAVVSTLADIMAVMAVSDGEDLADMEVDGEAWADGEAKEVSDAKDLADTGEVKVSDVKVLDTTEALAEALVATSNKQRGANRATKPVHNIFPS